MKPITKNSSNRVRLNPILWVLGVPLVATSLLYLVSLNDVLLVQFILAFVLLLLPWRAYVSWRRGGVPALPVFALLSLMYWVYYALPLFLEDHVFSTYYERVGHELPQSTITLALLMCVIGVCSLWLGMRSGLSRFIVPRTQLSLELTQSRLNYVRAVLIIGSLVGMFVALFRNLIRGESKFWDKVLVLGFLITRLMEGLSSGWLGTATSVLLVCGAIYLMDLRRIPRWALVLVVLFTLFFQVGKQDFRRAYWNAGEQGVHQTEESGAERAAFWVQTSLTKWSESLSDPTGTDIRSALNPSVARLSLLNQTANVIDLTPSVVPYQYGWLYSYMAVTLIPRFVWPDKPSMNEANQYYQVAYRLTSENDLGNVSIAVGFLTEGFINFGWAGVVGIMFLVGVFFDFYQKTFLLKTSGALMTGIGVILLPNFVGVEMQMAQYFGGILQQILVTMIVMLPIIRIQKLRSRSSDKSLGILNVPLLTPK